MRLNANAVNAMSLMAIQGANALFPLLIFPYLLVVLGENAFSELVIAEALAFYVLTICLYSFDTSGVQEIIEARTKHGLLSEAKCFYNIFGARIVLFVASSLPLIGGLYIFNSGQVVILFIWLSFVMGMILQSNYYFQAIENNFFLAFVVVTSRLFAVVVVYKYVQGEDDLLFASMVLAGSFLFSGMGAFIFALKRLGFLNFRLISIKAIYALLYKGRHLFFGNISVALFRGANILILAGVSSSTAVSVYALSEKVIKSIQAMARPLNQLYIPKAIKAWSMLHDQQRTSSRAFQIIWTSTRTQLYLMICALPLMIVAMYFGNKLGVVPKLENEVFMLIAFMTPAVIFGVANAMFGAVGLSLIGAQSYFAWSVFTVGASIFMFSLLMSYYFAASGAACAFVLAEMLLLVSFVWKYHWKPLRG